MLKPNPHLVHPIADQPRVVLLKPLISSDLIEVGDFSYYDDPDEPREFERRNVLYHYGPEMLRIGRFCSLAAGTTFIMNGANHRVDGPSAFPFPIMGGSWADHFDLFNDLPNKGDTVVGSDVWFGYKSLVMPGITIGNGAIVAAGSVVTTDVPDYGIVGGNPARLIRRRFSDHDCEALLAIAWWDWPLDYVTKHIRTLMAGTVEELRRASEDREL